jgi:hypothetical protein
MHEGNCFLYFYKYDIVHIDQIILIYSNLTKKIFTRKLKIGVSICLKENLVVLKYTKSLYRQIKLCLYVDKNCFEIRLCIKKIRNLDIKHTK